jgi:hypothetical protein
MAKKKVTKKKGKEKKSKTHWNPLLTTDSLLNLFDKDKGGRPRKFETYNDLAAAIIGYFQSVGEISWPKNLPTKNGLAIHLGTTRETLGDYESGKYDDDDNKFSDAIKTAYGLIEEVWGQELSRQTTVTGIIFYLKNAFKWRDRHEFGGEDGGPLDVNVTLKEAIDKTYGDTDSTEPEGN